MNESHYTSLEISKQLAELGIEFPESEKVWVKWINKAQEYEGWECDEWKLSTRIWMSLVNLDWHWKKGKDYIVFPAPSLSEVLDEFEKLIQEKVILQYNLHYKRTITVGIPDVLSQDADTWTNAAALMLIKIRKGND